ncbi:MAG TPA: tetratricopeptide repeat protein [Gemmatimonadales bacterium]|nr:tetratricopeptide repeat protein [Gemmatimonadales bacterium]
MATWRYGAALAGILAGLGGAAYLAFDSITEADGSRVLPAPVAPEPAPEVTVAVPPRDSTPAPVVDSASAPEPEVSAAPIPTPPRPAPWRPEPRQAMRDSVYLLTQAGRDAEALQLLDRWLASHPDDRDVRLESARLRLRTGDRAGAWQAYEQLLAGGGSTEELSEYAAALLANGENARAAQRYGELLQRDPSRAEWRLGAARALAWDGRPREALEVLRVAGDDPDGGLAALREQLRRQVEPTSAEAREWLTASPTDTLARLALARALVREGRAREALLEYDRLLAAAPSADRYAEAAGVAAGIPDSVATARLLGGAMALAPADTALRRRYREALAWSGDRAGAITQLDTLIDAAPTAALHLERARLRSWTGDPTGAMADANASIAMSPNAEAYALLGDLHRWQGQRAPARSAYTLGLLQDPNSEALQAGLAELHRTRYRDLPWDPDEGLGVTVRTLSDNEDFGSQVGRVVAGITLGIERRTVVSAGAEVRRLDRDSANANLADDLWGVGGDVGVSQRWGRLRAAGRVGLLTFSGVRDIVTGSLSLEGPLGGGRWIVEGARIPAYETLRSSRTLVTGPEPATAVTGLLGGLTVNVPLSSRVELWSRGEVLGLSDDNLRSGIQAAVRVGVVPSLSVLYAGGLLAFADSSDTYWSPTYYTLHSLGLEYRRRWADGWYVAGQGLVGNAWYEERLPGGRVSSSAFQWSATAEAGWQTLRWDLGAWAAFGTDRSGDYRSLSTTLHARYRW